MFDEKIEIRERCKGVHCVDLGESFPTSIYLQKSASIQPRTSPSKFGGKFNSLFTSLLSRDPGAGAGGAARLRGRHRRRLLVKTDRQVNLQKVLRDWLAPLRLPSAVRLTVDIDPYNFL